MSRLVAILIILAALATCASAQVPDTLGFQGFLTRSTGEPLDSTGVSMTFKLYKGATSVWTETQLVDVDSGAFEVYLGKVEALDTVAFNGPMDLGIKLDGEAPEMSPRTRLVGSAYAFAVRGLYAIDAVDGDDRSVNLVGGAANNLVWPGAIGATIGGGGGWDGTTSVADTVVGSWGTVGGGRANRASTYATVAGGISNRAYSPYSTVAGGSSNSAVDWYATVGGGFENRAGGHISSVGGGGENAATGYGSTVPGGSFNRAAGTYSLAAGYTAKANHNGSFVWADYSGLSSDSMYTTDIDQFLIRARGGVGIGTNTPGSPLTVKGIIESTMGGFKFPDGSIQLTAGTPGADNLASGTWATVAGGEQDTASGDWSAVGGGKDNLASGESSVVGGGELNLASSNFSMVGGGFRNEAKGTVSTVGGGDSNKALGYAATVPGGTECVARQGFTFAAGVQAKANHSGSFVWADSTWTDFATSGVNQFLIRAGGGVGIGTNTPGVGSGGLLPGGAQLDVRKTTGRAAHFSNSDGAGLAGATMRVHNQSAGAGIAGWLVSEGSDATLIVQNLGTGDILTAWSGGEKKLRVTKFGEVIADSTFKPTGADVAEAIDVIGSSDSYEPGDVLAISTTIDRSVEPSNEAYTTRVVGVYATGPGVLLSEQKIDERSSDRIPMAVVGIVPTKVTAEGGPIRRGDLLVTSSTPGHAMRAEHDRIGFGMVLGKAMGEFDEPGAGSIEVMLTIR